VVHLSSAQTRDSYVAKLPNNKKTKTKKQHFLTEKETVKICPTVKFVRLRAIGVREKIAEVRNNTDRLKNIFMR